MIRNVIAAVVVLALGVAGWSVWHQLDRPVRSVKVEGPLTAAEQAAIQAVVDFCGPQMRELGRWNWSGAAGRLDQELPSRRNTWTPVLRKANLCSILLDEASLFVGWSGSPSQG